ncbi:MULTISPECIES: hypothetical protein [unclassified Mesorhizobium]|uniref:hypothetical protein n=1 Tax=unclassified Mesorhizobium TaxID=325217 RepID=UPI0015E394E3|nr:MULTISPECIES: hypothetical protein [unclassified Mesorhizobium]
MSNEGDIAAAAARSVRAHARIRGHIAKTSLLGACGGNFDYDELTAAIAAVRPT